MIYKQFIEYIEEHQLGEYRENVSFKELTSLRIGGTTRVVFYPYTVKTLTWAFKYIKEKKIPYRMIGNGTNMLVNDRYFEMIIISLKNLKKLSYDDNGLFRVEAGHSAPALAYYLAKAGYTNMEFLSVIPGNIGGVVWMNAGAYKTSMVDILETVTYLDKDANVKVLDVKNNLNLFSYRVSPFQSMESIILEVVIRVERETNKCDAINKIQRYITVKKNTQPVIGGNAGSVFRNDDHYSAWQVIDKLGYRGYHIGDAYVSQKHANFFINYGNAKYSEMMELINQIKNDAKEKLNIDLRCEWEIID